MKSLILLFFLIAPLTSEAQVPRRIPDFKVTEQSLERAMQDYPIILDTADYERSRQDIVNRQPPPTYAYCLRNGGCAPVRIIHPINTHGPVCIGACPHREFWKLGILSESQARTAPPPGAVPQLFEVRKEGMANSAQIQEAQTHFQYDTPGTHLSGKLIRRQVYGPPGYGETPVRDKRTSIYVLQLPEPISVKPAAKAEKNNSANLDPFENIREVQVFFF